MFSEGLTNYETWQLAENLDPRIELRWIMPGRPTLKYVSSSLKHSVVTWSHQGVNFHSEIPKDEMVWRRPENSSNVIIPNATHLIPHDAPKELGE